MGKIDISVVIPAYNESDRLDRTLESLAQHFRGQEKAVEVIVVDDGSLDKTLQIANNAACAFPLRIRVLHHDINRGKGFAVRRGMLDAKGEILVYTDADLPVPFGHLEPFITLLRSGVDVVVGSRHVAGAKIGCRQPWYREFLGRAFNRLAHIMVKSPISDFNCALKVFHRHAAQEIFSRQTLSGWGFEVEILLIARRLGLKVKEEPVTWFHGENSRVRVFRDIPRSALELGMIAWNDLRALYGRHTGLKHHACEKQGSGKRSSLDLQSTVDPN